MRRLSLILGIALVAGLLVAAYYTYSERQSPAGQPPLARIGPESLADFQKLFNDSAGSTRLLTLLSPT